MPADTHEALDAAARTMCCPSGVCAAAAIGEPCCYRPDAMRASLLALAETVTDEMAERGGRALLLNVGWRPEEITALKATQDLVWQSAKAHARVVFVKMCRAAAGGGHD